MDKPREQGKGWIKALEDAERRWLQIDLQNNFSVVISVGKDGNPPRCTLWHGCGPPTDFEKIGIDEFREFTEVALGDKPLDPSKFARGGEDAG